MRRFAKVVCLAGLCGAAAALAPSSFAQAANQNAALITHRNAIEKELESIAIIDRKVMVPMRDGKRMQAARRATCPPNSMR